MLYILICFMLVLCYIFLWGFMLYILIIICWICEYFPICVKQTFGPKICWYGSLGKCLQCPHSELSQPPFSCNTFKIDLLYLLKTMMHDLLFACCIKKKYIVYSETSTCTLFMKQFVTCNITFSFLKKNEYGL